jgi:hypothetical protein
VDIDAFVTVHSAEWTRLEVLIRRARRASRLSGAEVDELVELYQRAATHLSLVQTRSPDPVVIARLSRLVTNGRSAVVGGHAPGWRQLLVFFTTTFPASVYRTRAWWASAPAATTSSSTTPTAAAPAAADPDDARAVIDRRTGAQHLGERGAEHHHRRPQPARVQPGIGVDA